MAIKVNTAKRFTSKLGFESFPGAFLKTWFELILSKWELIYG